MVILQSAATVDTMRNHLNLIFFIGVARYAVVLVVFGEFSENYLAKV